jgi:hypothetical protein
MGLGDGFHWNIADATLRSGHGATLKPFEPTRVAGFSRVAVMRNSFHRSGKPTDANGRMRHRALPPIFILAAFTIMAGWFYYCLIRLLSKFVTWFIS